MKYPPPPPPGIRPFDWELMLALDDVIYEAARRIRKPRRPRLIRRGSGQTLRPGAKTPLWNVLVKQALMFLGPRGSKVRLARFLGLPKQRVQDCLKARHATLDAERTLRLVCWVTARQRGKDLSVQILPPVT